MNKEKHKEYVDLCTKVWREVRSDKEKWVDKTMQGMEEGMRHHWQGAFQVKTGVSQGCVVSPLLFNCVMDRILKDTTNLLEGGLHIMYTSAGSLFLSYQNITTYIKMCCTSTASPRYHCGDQERTTAHVRCCARWDMQISVSKTKILALEE